MKKNLLLMASLLIGGFAFAQEETTVTIAMKPGYTDQVYYKFATNKQTPVTANSWDIAFQKAPSERSLGAIIVNDGAGIRLFQASAAIADWATITPSADNEKVWKELYNSPTTWNEGGFDKGTATYGWGEYNMADHHIFGSIVFVMKYSATSYKKFLVEDFNPINLTVKIKYATWDSAASKWGEDKSLIVDKKLDADRTFNFVSLTTDAAVTVAPANADWDLVFRKYYSPVTVEGVTTMYNVTGALQNSNVTVAQTTQAADATVTLPEATTYSADINTVGDDWKTFNGTAYTVAANNTFYIKDVAGKIYRAYFTAFSGSAAGTATFNYKDVTATAGLTNVNKNLSFGLYPNPTATKNVTLLYDLKNNATDNNVVTVYSLSGAKVYETKITNNSGFYNQELNLSSLSSGMYIVKLTAGNATATQKLVIQ